MSREEAVRKWAKERNISIINQDWGLCPTTGTIFHLPSVHIVKGKKLSHYANSVNETLWWRFSYMPVEPPSQVKMLSELIKAKGLEL